MSAILPRKIPSTRGVEHELRRKRLIAARKYERHTVPRMAILLGHWDGGSVVAGAVHQKSKRKRRRKSHGNQS
jgi:hypothetical protein